MSLRGPSSLSPTRGLIGGTLLVVGAVVALTLGLLVWWTLGRERTRIDQDFEVRAIRTAELAHLLLQREVARGQALLRGISASGAIQEALAEHNRSALNTALASFQRESTSMLTVVSDLDDHVLAWSTPLAILGLGISRREADTGVHPRVIRTAGDLAVLDERTIEVDGRPLGQVRVAVLIGRVFLRSAAEGLESPVALFYDGRAVHHTFRGDPPPPPGGARATGGAAQEARETFEPVPEKARVLAVRAEVGGTPFELGYRELTGVEPGAWIGAGVPRAAEEEAFRRFAWVVTGSAGGGLVVVLLSVAIFLTAARQRTSLIRERDAARRRSAGLSDRLAHLTAVVHDIKAPVGGIQLRCEALLEEGGNVETAPALSSIVDTCDRLNLYLLNVLTAAEAEEGPIRLQREVVLLPGLVEDVADRIGPLASRRRIQLETDAGHDLPPVNGDPVLLERALLNLASNAVAATPPGGRVCLFARREAGAIALGATDTGPGFTAFAPDEAFSRSRPVVKDASLRTSSGLGLFIVGRIAEAHGGHAVAANRQEGGASVAIRLPV